MGIDERTHRREADQPVHERADRLAELVTELTGTAPTAARHAVRSGSRGSRDALEVVANAMFSVDQPPPEGFRVTGFLRDGETEASSPGDGVAGDGVAGDGVAGDVVAGTDSTDDGSHDDTPPR